MNKDDENELKQIAKRCGVDYDKVKARVAETPPVKEKAFVDEYFEEYGKQLKQTISEMEKEYKPLLDETDNYFTPENFEEIENDTYGSDQASTLADVAFRRRRRQKRKKKQSALLERLRLTAEFCEALRRGIKAVIKRNDVEASYGIRESEFMQNIIIANDNGKYSISDTKNYVCIKDNSTGEFIICMTKKGTPIYDSIKKAVIDRITAGAFTDVLSSSETKKIYGIGKQLKYYVKHKKGLNK